MYVDKKLSGVQCVQTLSRLNRTKSGKTDTFVLDFVNETDDIVESFQPYFTSTILKEETDPDKLYELLYEIEQYQLYTEYQLDEFCKEFYSDSDSDQRLHPIIDVVVDTFKERLDEEQQDEYKSKIQSFIRMYSYISQISSFSEVKWEKSYVFLRFLNKKLPKRENERVSILDSIDLDSLRIQMMSETTLSLVEEQGEVYGISGESGKGMNEEEKVLLSDIIEKVNEVYGLNLGEDDRLSIEKLQNQVITDVGVRKVMVGNNTDDVKKEHFTKVVQDTFIDFYSDKFEMYQKMMNPNVFPMIVDGMYRELLRQLDR